MDAYGELEVKMDRNVNASSRWVSGRSRGLERLSRVFHSATKDNIVNRTTYHHVRFFEGTRQGGCCHGGRLYFRLALVSENGRVDTVDESSWSGDRLGSDPWIRMSGTSLPG